MEFRNSPPRCRSQRSARDWPLLLRGRPEVAQAFAAQFRAAPNWFDGPVDQLCAWRRAALAALAEMMPAGHVPPARVQTRSARRKPLAMADAGLPEYTIHGERSLHGVPDGSPVQLSPRRRND